MPKLHQILAVEKGAKGRAEKALTQAYHTIQKPELFNGLSRRYDPIDENGEKKPNEDKLIQQKTKDLIVTVRKDLTELFDVVATREQANTTAKASVVVGGDVLLKDVPVAVLLFLEKKLVDIRTFVSKLPTLQPGFKWEMNDTTGFFETSESKSGSKQKKKEWKVIVPPTDKHPAQTQLLEDEVLVGYWNESRSSAAIPVPEQQKILDRVDALIKAVKLAREEANSATVDEVKIGEKFFTYIFG